MQPQMIADYECVVGEGPLWHPGEQRVYWTDIATGRMFRYDPAADAHEQFYQGEIVGGFTIQRRRRRCCSSWHAAPSRFGAMAN